MTYEEMKNCRICPRECGADRTETKNRFGQGVCNTGEKLLIARAALHFWEEPCISGTRGSGAVFFSGCNLGCIYCQNAAISGLNQNRFGIEVTEERLSSIMLRLQNVEHANNINLVTGTHFIPQIAQALRIAKKSGLSIPVVWNTSGYEKVSSLKELEGLVDVWLPDFKYLSADSAKAYSHASDYPARVKEALAEMVRQTGGKLEFYPEPSSDSEKEQNFAQDSASPAGGVKKNVYEGSLSLIKKGVIVRHLLLPGHVKEARAVVQYLHETYKDQIILSLMNQYTPMESMKDHPLLGRKVTKREYERLVDYAIETGVNYGYTQEGSAASESFIPSWNGEGAG